MTIDELIEKAKTRANITSDYALSKVLGIDRRIVSDWKKGKRHPNNEEAIKLATLSGLEEMRVIAEIEYRTANTEKKKEFWHQYMESRGLAGCVAVTALGLALIATPQTSEASVLHLQNYETQNSEFLTSEIYIMRNNKTSRTLIVQAVWAKWCAFFSPLPDYVQTSFSR